jgi:hypothetical protein
MDVTEVLQIADELISTQTGQHLDNIQESVIKGVWQEKTYNKIAEECDRSESRVRNVAHKLWQLLSKNLGEEISKSNFRSTLKRLNIRSPSIIIQNNNHHFNDDNHHVNVCPFIPTKDDILTNNKSNPSQKPYYDLTLAPKITHFYERNQELEKLTEFILNQNTKLISVLGLSGIGKTTLVKRFIDLNLQAFDLIIWRSLKFPKSLDSLLDNILSIIDAKSQGNIDDKLTQILDIFTKKRCLIILDDVQELFIKGQFAGQYQKEYKEYKTLFTLITEIEHQSSLILISQEQCQEMLCLDEELYPVRCLELQGLDTIEILQNKGLQDEETWSTLIDLYEGNPIYLKDITNLIKNIFLGKVSDFLKEDTLLLTEDMKTRLTELFSRLSPIEKQIILKLSHEHQTLSREDLKESLNLSSSDLINGLQSLSKRYLFNTIKEKNLRFNLSPIWKAYLLTL